MQQRRDDRSPAADPAETGQLVEFPGLSGIERAEITPATVAADAADSWAQLCTLLWSERGLLEHLLFKLTTEQLVVASGSTRWLNQADDELQIAVAAMQDSEVIRAAEVDLLTRRVGAGPDTTLRELAETAPEPWGMLLADHREALRALALEIQTVAAENRRLLQAGADATRETLDRVGSLVSTYDAHGEAVATRPGAYLLDQQA
jgi:hypothetical protein